MKKNRQQAIIELVRQENIETQEELLTRLQQMGFQTTQATISRDIRELELTKVSSANGRQAYALIENEEASGNRYHRMLSETIVSVDLAENIMVIKTVSGMAMACAAALDALEITGMVGTIAGDDTIMCALKDKKIGKTTMTEVKQYI